VRSGRIEPLWDRIERNRLRVGIFIAAFVAAAAVSAGILVTIIGIFLGVVLVAPSGTAQYFHSLPWIVAATLAGGAFGAGVYVGSQLNGPHRRLPGHFGAVPSDVGTLLPTKSALHDMAIAAGLAHSLALWVIEDSDRINAFVLGTHEEDAVVGVTQGFATRLSTDDQRAVFANLMARLRDGDAVWATVVAAIMGPIWGSRSARFKAEDSDSDVEEVATQVFVTDSSAAAVPLFVLGMLGVVVTEVLMRGHERAARASAEKGDAEGMLLLKDPAQMLDALGHVLEADNTVPAAGDAYSMLFYCWAGFGYAPEDDPEMERIPRLREVLGAAAACTSGPAAG
jgi:Zn-dependent protease with chaperone function